MGGNHHQHQHYTSKMFKYDGIYQRESFDKEYATALLMEMGFSEADIKLMTDRKNVDRVTMMEYKDKTITHLEEFSLAPHLNYTTTTKIGEAFKMKKPYPCTITWIKTTDDEFVTRIEINGFYELEKEENLLPLLRQMMPDLKVDDFERMKKRGICLTWKEETGLITILEHFWDEKEKMVLKLDEAIDIHHKESGIEETRVLTKISPGHFKMICKLKKDGRIVEQ